MAQVPATPKIARARHLFTARLFGPDAVAGEMLQASEKAALNLRKARGKAGDPGPATEVVFLIPLVGRHHISDWDGVTARLNLTLHSFLNQTNPNWRAVICGQDAPDLPDDQRISFLPFTTDMTGNDKWAKLRTLVEHLPELGIRSGYAMSFDADDLLHRAAVAEVLSRQDAGGYLVARGFVRDVSTGVTALAGPPSVGNPLRKPFWKLCGSCAAFRFDLDALPECVPFLAETLQHEHRMFPYLAALAGAPLTPFSVPSAMYLLNHGENFGARRGRVSFKTRFVERFRIDDEAVLQEIAKDFPSA